ncbi:MAG: hypothetical protein JXL81_08550 [Deltaproteobacteria bacterium]|nr:hypothetical protein [Deltaproteobacteria bacterium]
MRSEGEVLLVYYLEKPAVYARIETIEPDIKRGWFHVTLMLLTVPARTVTWILREAYIDGEPFTIDGMTIKLEEVKKSRAQSKQKETVKSPAKVIPLKRE